MREDERKSDLLLYDELIYYSNAIVEYCIFRGRVDVEDENSVR